MRYVIWVAVLLIAALAWFVEHQSGQLQGVRSELKEANGKADDEKRRADAYLLAMRAKDAAAFEAQQREAEYLKRLKEADDETKTLADDVADARRRLRVAASCMRASSGTGAVPGTASTDAGGAELDSAARPAYYALRSGILKAQAQIAGLQQRVLDLRSVCKVTG